MSVCPIRLVRVFRYGWVAAVIAVVIVSLRPLPPGMDIPGGDKTAHLVVYMILAATFAWPLTRNGSLVLFASLMVCGMFLEVAQHVMGLGRSGEIADILANGAGAFAGCMLRIVKKHGSEG